MKIDLQEFQTFTGVYEDDAYQENFLEAGTEIVNSYLGFSIENYEENVPALVRHTVYRIAALLQKESNGNLGLGSKSFGESGSTSFLNVVNYEQYLKPLSEIKLQNEIKEIELNV